MYAQGNFQQHSPLNSVEDPESGERGVPTYCWGVLSFNQLCSPTGANAHVATYIRARLQAMDSVHTHTTARRLHYNFCLMKNFNVGQRVA